MIITCPECRTRYRVAAEAIAGPRGRKLRCAGCGHVWHYLAEPGAAAPPPLRAEPDASPAAARAGPAAPRRRKGALRLVLVLLVLVAGAIAAGILARDRIAARWPFVARIYGLAGIAVASPGDGPVSAATAAAETRRGPAPAGGPASAGR